MIRPVAGSDSDDSNSVDPIFAPLVPSLNPSVGPVVERLGVSGWVNADAFEDWQTPAEALQALAFHFDRQIIIEAMLRRLGLGLIQAAAEVTTLSNEEGKQQEAHGFVPTVFWSLSTAPDWKNTFWKTGDLWFSLSAGYTMGNWIEFTGVRFEPAGLAKLARALGKSPQTPKPPEEPLASPAARRGAKRKMWWDDLWIEMIRRIHAGTLNPKDKAALQEILETCVMHDLNGEYGDSTLKPMASKLFDYLEEFRGK